ncbi:MAG: hypothetical protein A2X11_02390 [Bacteroidetes bacterium GWE2_42_24]|nr:MAG: hypothetical protein A2X11_02390 [Bacteroidetes bacterium GWE2_42_24]OFY25404.1 MAG: hypothetical protein A2X09_02925 [Bacteroidetes bacterium GWF2_43_11]
MRSDFFNEIAESRERFYIQCLGERKDIAKNKPENDSKEPGEDADEVFGGNPNTEERRELLLNFLGKMKFWVGF